MLYTLTLLHSVRYSPLAPALIKDDRILSFSELSRWTDRIAADLIHRGLKRDDRLAVLLLNCPEYVPIIMACARLGIIVVPMNTRYSQAEVDAVIEDCGPRGIIRHNALPKPAKSLEWEVVLDDTQLGAEGELPEPMYDPDAIFGLFYTSGTTGRAKGVMLTHANLHANNLHTLPHIQLGPGKCYLHAAPMFHLADFPCLLMSLGSGACQVTIPRFELQSFCAMVQLHRVTNALLIPTMINFLTQYPELNSFDLSSLETTFYGGSPIAPEVLKRAREKLPRVKFSQGYGMTEASPILTILRDHEHLPDKLLSCGKPPYGIDLMVADPDGNPMPTGESGEIAARGANVMKGYWNKPEETARTIRNGWLFTGDIGQQDAEGFFYIVDRSKDMIVTGGENVYSTEVESAIYSHAAVKEAAVIGIPDKQWGELVMACVVVRDDCTVTADELIDHCRKYIANYKLPRRVEFYPNELPKSGTGKIMKRTLRDPFWKGMKRAVG